MMAGDSLHLTATTGRRPFVYLPAGQSQRPGRGCVSSCGPGDKRETGYPNHRFGDGGDGKFSSVPSGTKRLCKALEN